MMDLDTLAAYLRSRPSATEGTAWGPEHWVYKVGGKLFAVLSWDEDPMRMSLKCPPERVEELRAVFPAIQPPAYFNKRHWNLIVLDGSVPDLEIEAMIDTSHELIVASLTKKTRSALGLD